MEIISKTIHEELWDPCSAPSSTAIARWAKRFRQGRKYVNDHPRAASPVSEFTGENIELVRQVIINDLS